MDRSRSKRNYYYDQDYDSETLVRSSTKPRYNHHYPNNNNNGHHYRRGGGGNGGARSGKGQEPPGTVTTNYRILCHDMKAGGVIGKSGSIIKTIRQHTGAWINVHELVPGDEERVIEISDTRRRDPDGRMPAFSPAQEALFMIHERILESNDGFGVGNFDDGDDYGFRHGVNRVVSRLVVSRMHVGSLLGKGGKIIEQMRMETKTHIRVLPRDNTLPRCVSMSEEIVQVVGDVNNVKNAIAIISSRIRESQHRDRSHHQGRMNSPDDRFFPPDDDFIPYQNNTPRRSSMDGSSFGSQQSGLTNISRNDNYASRPSDYNSIDSGPPPPMVEDAQPSLAEGIVFQILCPIDKIDCIVGDSDGIIDLLRDEIGVDITVTDPFANSDERIIIIYSEEGPDNELFPAQEALLHIQTRIVDLVQDKENIITTRLIIPTSDIGCLKGKDGSVSDMSFTGANIHILSKEQLPVFIMPGTDEIVQIRGEIKAARNAIIEVTSRLRSYIFRDLSQKNMLPMDSAPSREVDIRNNQLTGTNHQALPETAAQLPKVSIGSIVETPKPSETDHREVVSSVPNRTVIPLVTRSILEVVLPDYAIPKLITRSKNKLAQISELSGANIKLVEDGPESTEKIIQISGTPEQAERAQSLLQGFILSTQEDGP